MNGRASRLVPYLLAFFSSLCIMILELVASRLVARHVGASLSVWTSVIGIMLGGICLGNVLGGRLADRLEPTRALGPLYALGAALTLGILAVNGVVGYLPGRAYLPLSFDTILVVSLDFLVPGTVLGMIGPIVAKIAVDRARRSGGALGDVYFSGAVGSIAGTFLAGFVLMYLAPTSTIVILVAAGLLFVGLVLVRDGELSGGVVTGGLLGVALAIGLVGLMTLGVMLFHNDASEQAQDLLAAGITIFYVALGFLGAAFLAATAAAAIELDSRAVAAVAAVTLLGLGSVEGMGGPIRAPGVFLGTTKINLLAIGAALVALGLAVDACLRLRVALDQARAIDEGEPSANPMPEPPAVDLTDLCVLAFLSSLGFMTLEMVAGRFVTRHLGSSIYGWTSIIGVLLGGLSLGNWLGGRIANRVTDGARAATLFLVASVFTAAIIVAETPREWMVRNPIEYFTQKADPVPLAGKVGPLLTMVNSMEGVPWPIRILFWVSVEFLLPAVAMGTIGPVVAKLAVERVRARTKGTGAAIGRVYAWGMVGSILGTFLTGFFLIGVFGTKGVVLLLSTMLAIIATVLGKVRHAAWAGIPMGLCVIAFLPPYLTVPNVILARNVTGGLLVLAAVAAVAVILRRKARGDDLDVGGTVAYLVPILFVFLLTQLGTMPQVPGIALQRKIWKSRLTTWRPQSWVNGGREFLLEQGMSWGLREKKFDTSTENYDIAYLDESDYYYIKIENEPLLDEDVGSNRTIIGQKRTLVLDNLIHGYFIKDQPKRLDYDYEHIYALVTHRVMEARARAAKVEDEEKLPLSTLFLGGGSYTFPRYLQAVYPRTTADVAEIDPAVTEANHRALWLPREKGAITTTWGDARQFVDNHQGKVKYDLIFGDAFNDFSVPWHLTTKEFNDHLNALLSDDGVYMINIIDKYLADRKAVFEALDQGRLGEKGAVRKTLEDAGAEDSQRLADKIMVSLDRRKLGVNITEFARKADAAVEKVSRITDAASLERMILRAYEEAKIPMRGSTQELYAAVVEVLQEDEATSRLSNLIPQWAAAVVEADFRFNNQLALPARAAARGIYEAREFGSFLGAWVETAHQSFGEHVYVFGTDSKPGNGQRETFVVVASRKPLDLEELGARFTDVHFHNRSNMLVTPEVYDKENMKAVKVRSRGIILTDDYAPIENLLAPVARTRAVGD